MSACFFLCSLSLYSYHQISNDHFILPVRLFRRHKNVEKKTKKDLRGIVIKMSNENIFLLDIFKWYKGQTTWQKKKNSNEISNNLRVKVNYQSSNVFAKQSMFHLFFPHRNHWYLMNKNSDQYDRIHFKNIIHHFSTKTGFLSM